jgi:hypothetical protein
MPELVACAIQGVKPHVHLEVADATGSVQPSENSYSGGVLLQSSDTR